MGVVSGVIIVGSLDATNSHSLCSWTMAAAQMLFVILRVEYKKLKIGPL